MLEYSDHTLNQIYAIAKAAVQKHNVDDATLQWYACVCHTFGISPTNKLSKDQLPSLLMARYRGIRNLLTEQVMPILPVTFADALFQECICGTPLVGYQTCSTFYLQGKRCMHTDVLIGLLEKCRMHSIVTAAEAGMSQDQLDALMDQLSESGMLRIVARNRQIGGYATCMTDLGMSMLTVHARLVYA